MTPPARAPRGLLVPAIVTAIVLAGLIFLGNWQLERKAWKERLIETLTLRLAAVPTELPARERWLRLDPLNDEFRRVAFPAEFLTGEEALVYAGGSALRPDVTGPGYWVFSPARLAGGSIVVVNRGFVPEGRQDLKTRPAGEPTGVVDITGAMRWPEVRGTFTPDDDPARNLWFARDPAGMAAAKGWGAVAPFYVDQEAPAAPGGLPRVGRLTPSLPNNHLQYAITWYGITLVLITAFAAFCWTRRRETQA